jgi:hypothetical protein|tara:strand:- start:262 stop:564 length:303 start_codon:yes stop_codon:yes gene_type:complete
MVPFEMVPFGDKMNNRSGWRKRLLLQNFSYRRAILGFLNSVKPHRMLPPSSILDCLMLRDFHMSSWSGTIACMSLFGVDPEKINLLTKRVIHLLQAPGLP